MTDRRPTVLSRRVDQPVAAVAAGNASAPTIRRSRTGSRSGSPLPDDETDRSSVVRHTAGGGSGVVTHRPRIEALHQRLRYKLLEKARYRVGSNNQVGGLPNRVSRSERVHPARRACRGAPLPICHRLERRQSKVRVFAAARESTIVAASAASSRTRRRDQPRGTHPCGSKCGRPVATTQTTSRPPRRDSCTRGYRRPIATPHSRSNVKRNLTPVPA